MRFIIALMFLTVPAMAQEQQMASPSQLAVQIDNAVGIIAQRAEYAEAQLAKAQQQIAKAQQQIVDLQKQFDALKPKDEPK